MQRYIAFLRGINLGKRRPPMSQLRDLFGELGFEDVETFIASGNIIFSSRVTNAGRLEAMIADHLAASLGYEVDTFVRTAKEVVTVGAANVFPEADREGMTVHVAFLQRKLAPELAGKLTGIRTDGDEFRVLGREFYWLCRGRTSDSKVWALPEMKALRLPTSTMRNMTSIRRLIAKHLV